MSVDVIVDTTAKANPPIPSMLDVLDKQITMLAETAQVAEERLNKVLRPAPDTAQRAELQAVPHLGGSNIATRLAELSSQVGHLTTRLNDVMERLEL